MKTAISKKRRGISGLMQVAMIVGIVIIFAGILFNFAGDIFDVQTVTDSISLQKIYIHKVGDEVFVSGNVKNTGNTEITNLTLDVFIDTNSATAGIQPFSSQISPAPLTPGMTGSTYVRIVDSNGANIAITTGQEVTVVMNATTTKGSNLTEPVTVRVR